ncbi:hypothetical protein D6D26_08529 [Aureobasidium pullulans]|nr:hypothetical protein D6D26_08529 [Aureobasidium pullulans]
MSNIAAPQSMSNSNSWLSGTMHHSLNSPVAGPLNDLEVNALTSIGHALTAQVPRSPSPPTAPEYEEEDDYSSIPVPRGTTCKRKGCGMTYTGDPRAENQPCLHHPGAPTFHNGNKGWSCCERRVWIFDEFLSIPGCKTSARHMFDGTKSNSRKGSLNFQRSISHRSKFTGITRRPATLSLGSARRAFSRSISKAETSFP